MSTTAGDVILEGGYSSPDGCRCRRGGGFCLMRRAAELGGKVLGGYLPQPHLG